jgi:ABC-type glycerol-3-phosphate transport system substrate-binding protein
MKRYAALFLFTAALLASTAQARTPLRIWIPWDGPDGEAISAAAKAFGREQPDYDIQVSVVPAAGIDASSDDGQSGQFLTAVRNGNPPDLVLYWGNDVIAGLVAKNAIVPLDELLGAVQLGSFAFNSAAWTAMKYNGHVWGVPQMINARLLFINAAHAKAAGLDVRKPPQTIKELDAWADRMTLRDASGAIRRLGFLPWSGQGKPDIWTGYFGGSLINPATGQPDVQNGGTLEAARWFERTTRKWGPENLARFTASFADIKQSSAGDPFVEGRVSMQVNGGWHANFIRKANPNLKYVVARVPVGGAGKYGSTFIDGNTWLVPRGARNAPAAMKFVAWLSQGRRNAELADRVYNVSPVRDALPFQESLGDPAIRLSVAMVSNPGSFALPQSDRMLAVRRQLESGFNDIVSGSATAAEMLAEAQKQLDRQKPAR